MASNLTDSLRNFLARACVRLREFGIAFCICISFVISLVKNAFEPQSTQRSQRKHLVVFATLFSISLWGAPGYFEPWGKDTELLPKEEIVVPAKSLNILSRAVEQCILFHQNVISPIDGPRSHFRPTSARYMLISIRRYGFLKGYLMGCDRLLRENKDPWVYRTRIISGKEYKWDPTF
jgi:putative component of membrane protein insertase Oxa1/YidC/SpoIIIJ protein YidD